MDTSRSEAPPDRLEYVTITTIRNSFGVLDAVAAIGVYGVMRAVRAMRLRLRSIRNGEH
jgi:hypothetical protein